jgi:hypothetical protein
LTTANPSAYIYHSIGNSGVKTTTGPGGFGINTGFNVNPRCALEVSGKACIHNGSPSGITYMQSGSLTIGGTNANYGCAYYNNGDWTGTNTAGLLMECADNTEIVIHDSSKRLVSAIAYYGNDTNYLYIGRAMGWDGGAPTPVYIPASLAVGGLLTCSGSTTSTPQTFRYFNAGQALTSDITSFNNICAKFNGSIWVTSWIASSDVRIKKNIQDINDNTALLKILAIEPKTYQYIDIITKGTETVYGFIAQQIREVIPEAVKLDKTIIPNIYKLCDCENDEIQLSNDIIISSNLNIDDKINIININNNRKEYTITEILDNSIKINENLNSSNCFVYGKEVDDFHTLDKTYIFTLNVCATQELYKIIQEQNNKINDLQNEIIAIKQHLNL